MFANPLLEVVAASTASSFSNGSGCGASVSASPSASAAGPACSGDSTSKATFSASRCHSKLRSIRSRHVSRYAFFRYHGSSCLYCENLMSTSGCAFTKSSKTASSVLDMICAFFSWTTNGPTRRRITSRVHGLVGQWLLKWSRMVFFTESEMVSDDVALGGVVSEGGIRLKRALPFAFE